MRHRHLAATLTAVTVLAALTGCTADATPDKPQPRPTVTVTVTVTATPSPTTEPKRKRKPADCSPGHRDVYPCNLFDWDHPITGTVPDFPDATPPSVTTTPTP